MPQLELLRSDHAPAVLDFELANRAYFAKSISDRGDDFFAHFDERHAAMLAEQAAGECYFHVLVDDEGRVLGRFNLFDAVNGSADLGYRVAERVSGRGVASGAVREICVLAAQRYGLTTLAAVTSLENLASRRVLERTGFELTGDVEVAGRPGVRYVKRLAAAAGR